MKIITAAPISKKGFIAITKHNSSSDGDYSHKATYEEAVDEVHQCFLDYDFEIRDGKPYDPGHESSDPTSTEAFDCLSDVIMFNGKVAQFTHCNGDGPEGEIRKNN